MDRSRTSTFTRTPARSYFVAMVIAAAVLPLVTAAEEDEEIAHPFFTHEGLPDAVGSYSMRTSALSTRSDGGTDGDFAYHVETGLTDTIGLHLRSDQFLQSRRSEAMLQFVAWKSRNGESGFAPIIEYGFPSRSGGGKPEMVVGFTSKFASSKVAFNQALHYSPVAQAYDGSVALVVRATKRVYPVVEFLGEWGAGKPTVVNALAGVKYRVRGGTLLGLAYQRPITGARDLSSQVVLQLEFMLGKMK